jgi:hypothetical protein
MYSASTSKNTSQRTLANDDAHFNISPSANVSQPTLHEKDELDSQPVKQVDGEFKEKNSGIIEMPVFNADDSNEKKNTPQDDKEAAIPSHGRLIPLKQVRVPGPCPLLISI